MENNILQTVKIILKGSRTARLGVATGMLSFLLIDTKLIHPMLEKSRGLYRNLFENANDAIFLIDLDKQALIDVNGFSEKLVDYSRQELQGMSVFELIPEAEADLFIEKAQEMRAKGAIRNVTGIHLKRKDGSLVSIDLSASVIDVEGRRIIQAIVRDITAQKLAEEKQRRYLKDLETLSAITLEISGELEIEELLPKIAEHAVSLAGGDAGGVGLIDKEARILEYIHLCNLPKLPDMISVNIDTSTVGDVIESRRAVIIDDYPSHPKAYKGFIDSGVKTAILVPIIGENNVQAVIEVFGFSYAKKFGVYHRNLLEAVARQASIAIENAMLHEQVNEALQTSNLLLGVSEAVGTTLDMEEILKRLVNVGARSMGLDHSHIGLYDTERTEITIVASTDTERIGMKLKSSEVGPELTALLSGEHLIADIDDPLLSPQLKGLMKHTGIKSCLCSPLLSASKTIGFIAFGSSQKLKFDSRQVILSRGIAYQAVMAIQNATLYTQTKTALEKERYIAEELQRSLLPVKFPQIPHTDVGAYYASATEEARVGGDFYDIIPLPDKRYALMIGDVSGKGIEAAASTAMVKYIIRTFIYQYPSPAFALSQANSAVAKQIEKGTFVTVFCATYDARTGTIVYSNAGHPHPCLFNSAKGTCSHLPSFDPAMGIIQNYNYRESSITLSPGSFVAMFTDGTFEARRDGEFFGEERLMQVIEESSSTSAQYIADKITRECFEFSEGKLGDDIAVLIIKRI